VSVETGTLNSLPKKGESRRGEEEDQTAFKKARRTCDLGKDEPKRGRGSRGSLDIKKKKREKRKKKRDNWLAESRLWVRHYHYLKKNPSSVQGKEGAQKEAE